MEGWQIRRLGDVCDFKGGGTPSKAVDRYWQGDIPWVSPKDMKSQVVVDSIDHITREAVDASATSMIEPGSILMVVRSGILARTVPIAFAGRALAMNQDLKALCPRPSMDSWFLYYLLEAKMSALLALVSRGATVHRLITDQIRAVEFMMPSLAEQERIVAILDAAFDAVATAKANAEKNLQNSRELFTNGLERVFSESASRWRCVALERIGATQTGSTPKSSEPENLGDYLPFVKPGDFNRDGSITFDNEGLSEGGASKARRVKANSALMVCIGATIGKAGFSEREIATNQQVNAWTPTTDTSAKFIYYQMTTGDFQRRVRQSAGQATLPIINKSKWSALTVVVPPTLDEQTKIVADLDILLAESMNLEAVYERKISALDELKKSLLHQAFTGALTAKSTDNQLEAVA